MVESGRKRGGGGKMGKGREGGKIDGFCCCNLHSVRIKSKSVYFSCNAHIDHQVEAVQLSYTRKERKKVLNHLCSLE